MPTTKVAKTKVTPAKPAKPRRGRPRKLAVSPRAAEKLRAVAKHILEEPLRLYMGHWVVDVGTMFSYARDVERFNGALPSCGTAACVAGWILTLDDGGKRATLGPYESYEEAATRITGDYARDHDTDFRIKRLFFIQDWPKEYAISYDRARTAGGRARVTAKRIEHYIHTGK